MGRAHAIVHRFQHLFARTFSPLLHLLFAFMFVVHQTTAGFVCTLAKRNNGSVWIVRCERLKCKENTFESFGIGASDADDNILFISAFIPGGRATGMCQVMGLWHTHYTNQYRNGSAVWSEGCGCSFWYIVSRRASNTKWTMAGNAKNVSRFGRHLETLNTTPATWNEIQNERENRNTRKFHCVVATAAALFAFERYLWSILFLRCVVSSRSVRFFHLAMRFETLATLAAIRDFIIYSLEFHLFFSSIFPSPLTNCAALKPILVGFRSTMRLQATLNTWTTHEIVLNIGFALPRIFKSTEMNIYNSLYFIPISRIPKNGHWTQKLQLLDVYSMICGEFWISKVLFAWVN